ncbi:TPA: L,D-transpeptidase family protein [Legionella pneumophila]|nr:L,D-transpeptidase family protein [Legionella pneumophila]HAU2265710.1 L,D-transpeptidase family protein [Legionella pneumophila]HBD7143499.1 L,D-transpeptidase family protein [Legionella pneumophila]
MEQKSKSIMRVWYLILLLSQYSFANVYVLPEAGNTVGEIQVAFSEYGETIDEVGRRFNVGYYEMVRANPGVNARYPLAANTKLIIPSRFILPNVPRKGVVINLAEYRLYYFPPDDNVVMTYPVGIGKKGWETPLGLSRIISKEINPTWRPTVKLQKAAESIGAPIPSEFPPGPHNPLGQHVLRLGWPAILIHGSNRVDGIGAKVSAGCIRMLPEDIEHLYSLVSVGTPVRIISAPLQRQADFKQ